LDKILFAQALATSPHLSLGGFFGMLYEHLSGCFILKDPSLGSLELFQTNVIIVYGDIPRSVALMLGVNRLLAMAKDTCGLYLIAIGNVFIQLISCSLSYNFKGYFNNTYLAISLGYQTLEAMKPSLLAFKPSLIYNVIRP